MWFGELSTQECEHCILAHSIRTDKRRISKGTVLDQATIDELLSAGYDELTVARLDDTDVGENVAARQLADVLSDNTIRAERAHTGRVNLYAEFDGLLTYDTAAVIAANSVSPDITLSVLAPDQWVLAGRMIASVKIIPYAVPLEDLDQVITSLNISACVVHRPHPSNVVLIQSRLPSVKAATLDKTRSVTEQRVQSRSSELVAELRCEHTLAGVSDSLATAIEKSPDIILIVGASAISDYRDVLPASVRQCGGTVQRVGLPVDPGNLLMLGDLNGVPVLGLPGCARSPKHNGVDLLLDRIVVGLSIDDQWLNRLCIGGLLGEVHDRPQPRVTTGESKGVAALILAAGSSRRSGSTNKLLHHYCGKPMVCSVVESVTGSAVVDSLIVTGHQSERVVQAVESYGVNTCHCAGFMNGMAHSIATGLSQLQSYDAVLVCLGDMPHISSSIIDLIISASSDSLTDKIIVPVHQGRRGNPVMIGRAFFDSLLQNEGDSGARNLIKMYPEQVVEVDVGSDAIFLDYDTEDALKDLDNS